MGCGASATGSAVSSPEALAERLKDSDPETRRRAAKSLGELGDAAAPYAPNLVEALSDADLEVTARASRALGALGSSVSSSSPTIAKLLGNDSNRTRNAAEDALKELGNHAAPAVPELRAQLKGDSDSCQRSLRTLGRLKSHAAPAGIDMAKLMSQKNTQGMESAPAVRKCAKEALLQLGPDGASAAEELASMLQPGEAKETLIALEVLRGFNSGAAPASPQLARLLVTENEDLRREAVELLSKLGTDAGDAAPELAKLLGNSQPDVVIAAVRALGTLGPHAAPITEGMVKLLQHKDEEIGSCTADVLGQLGEHAAPAVPALAQLLLSVQPKEGFTGTTKVSQEAVSVYVSLNVLNVLAKLGKHAAPAVVHIPRALANNSLEVREKAVEVLGLLGDLGCAGPAISTITPLLAHSDGSVRMTASDALKRLGGNATSGAGDIAKLLGSDKYDVRRKAMETLDELGPRAAPAAPEVAKLLASENEDVRRVAEEALRKLGPQAASAAPDLLPLLTHRKDHVRQKAAAVLRDLGDQAVSVIKKVIEESEDWHVRRRLVEQIGKLGADAAPYVPSIAELLNEESVELKIVVASLLRDLAETHAIVPREVEAKVSDIMKDSLHLHVPPSYWCNRGHDFDEMVYVDKCQHEKFNKLFKETYFAKSTQDRLCPKGVCKKTKGGCPCVQPGGDPGLPTEYLVRRVVRVENALMWARYVMKRDAIRVKRSQETEPFRKFEPPIMSSATADACPEVFMPLEHELNEVYLFHGTYVRAAVAIAKNDFRIDLAGSSTGTMYGLGAYLGESVTKADEYAKHDPGGYYDGVFAVLLVRSCMGKLYYTTKRDEEAGTKVGTGSFDSTCGDRSKYASTFREMVVYDNDQLYPEYIIFYQRVHARDDRASIVSSLELPFHMEMPPYWTNCYRPLSDLTFNERYVVPEATLGSLQRLLDASLEGSKWQVMGAQRVENSEVWRQYIDFKVKLRLRLTGTACTQAKVVDTSAPEGTGEVITSRHLEQENVELRISLGNVENHLNELFLWHATSREGANSIASNNFQIASSGPSTSGLRYGPGAYFAESLEKALAYSIDDAEGKRYVLLCRVACGNFYYTAKDIESEATQQARAAGRDSVLANPLGVGPREFIVMDAVQAYPEFILEVTKP